MTQIFAACEQHLKYKDRYIKSKQIEKFVPLYMISIALANANRKKTEVSI